MKLSDFDYHLPTELIAQYPAEVRGDSRLLHLDCQDQSLSDYQFTDLGRFLKPGDLLVLNDTKVIPARLFGQKVSGGQVEILLERILSATEFLAQIRASKASRPGTQILIGGSQVLEIVSREDDLYRVKMLQDTNVWEFIEQHGHVPLPPYIERDDELIDRERYQTVYARQPGAVAAPTAGLHFTNALLTKLADQGVSNVSITLHVGAGTFQPVRVNTIEQHKMHREHYVITDNVVREIKHARKGGGRVIAVGTTSLRSLESAALKGQLGPVNGDTDLFIYPGFKFQLVDGLITNFHLPQSTLLMLVSAFAGTEFTRRAYRHAVKERYRFFSYGDAMFINR